MVVKNVEIEVLVVDSRLVKAKLKSRHGLALFIQAKIDDKEVTILMDTGQSSNDLLGNADKMDIDLQKIDIVALSHGHYDHTGGLLGALKKIKKRVLVIAHPRIFDPKLKIMPHLRFIGTPCKSSDIEYAGGVTIQATDPVNIAKGITTTGEIPRTTAFEKIGGFLTVHNNRLVEDLMLDDQALIINLEKKGLVVISGCAHAGIINTIKHAQNLTGTNKVYAVLGGFHLINVDDKRIQATVDEFKNLDLEFIGPCHCTGAKATEKIAEAFGDRCRPLLTGDIIKF